LNDFDDNDGQSDRDDLKPPLKADDRVSLARLTLKRARELLPKGTAAAGSRRGERSPLRLSRRGDQPRVLLVDDDEVIRRLMTKIIEGRGMSCTAVESAEEAIPVMERELFDALVLDKNLPGMDGVELAGLARRIQPGVPVLMITGYSSEESARQAAAFGVTDYILKPIDLAEFRARLIDILTSGPSRAGGRAEPAEQQGPRETPRVADAGRSEPEPIESDRPAVDGPPSAEAVAVVIVEPEHSVRGKLEAVLRPLGCEVSSYSEPADIRLALGKRPFELLVAPPFVLNDSQTWEPQSGGWRLLGSIAIMDRGGVDKAIEAIHLGARGAIHPPFEPDETTGEIRRVVSALLQERQD
jgi:DNA-binding NtrC family response regulator